MKISAQEEYGLRCLLRVARAEPASVTLPEVARAEGLSVPHAAKLLGVLRQAGLIDSVRGRAGGYHLALRPEAVGLGSVLLALGEPLYDEADYCHKHAGTSASGVCVNHAACNLKSLWQTLAEWMREALDQITLADLLRHEAGVTDLLRQRLTATALKKPAVALPVLSS